MNMASNRLQGTLHKVSGPLNRDVSGEDYEKWQSQ